MSNQAGTLWIGDLDPYIDEAFLKQSFLLMGEILRQAKIIRNKYDGSKLGYGFLEFGDEAIARRVLNRCNGKVIPNSNGSKRFRLNYANQGKDSGLSSRSSMPAVPGQDYQQCYQYPAYDYQSYYAAWQNYQNPYYNYNYDQNYAAAAAATYDTSRYQQTQPPQPQAQPQAQLQQQQQQQQQQQSTSATQQTTQAQQTTSQYYNSTYDASDNLIEEHDTPPDVEQLNEDLMNRNEELYAALENSRWLPVEDLVPPLLKIK